MRPWFAEVTLSLLVDARAGAVVSQGVEEQIETLAPPTARRRSFETARQQIAFLADAAMADQVAALDETLREIEERPWAYGRVVDEWMAGDLKGVAADALEPLRRASPTIYRRLITDRNRRWAGALQRRLSRPGTVVVIVGMGHLVGPGGVPALLRAGGVKGEGPIASPGVGPPKSGKDARIDRPGAFPYIRASRFSDRPPRLIGARHRKARTSMANNPGAKKAIRKIAQRTEVNKARPLAGAHLPAQVRRGAQRPATPAPPRRPSPWRNRNSCERSARASFTATPVRARSRGCTAS